MTYFQPCKLNCQICKTYCCFDPLLSALSFANSSTLELTLANRNLGFQLSGIRKICDYVQSAIALCDFLSIINIEMCDFYRGQYVEMCKFLHVDSAEKCGGALC